MMTPSLFTAENRSMHALSIQKSATFVDLFAGCGGLSLGLEQAGFFPLFVNELNDHALETYLQNRDMVNPLLRTRFHVNDVKDLVKKRGRLDGLVREFESAYGFATGMLDVDLVCGGPPCQGFSGIGHRRSYSVDREQLPSNHLFQDMAYVVSRIRPKLFLFENVEGLLRAKWTSDGENGEIFMDVLSAFRAIKGYQVRFSLVRAKDYGVPQNRPRVLLVGVREDVSGGSSFPAGDDAVAAGFLPSGSGEPAYPSIVELLSDLVDPVYVNGGETPRYPSSVESQWQRKLRSDPSTGSARRKGAELTDHKYSRHAPHVVERFQYMIENGGEIPPHLQTKKFAQRVLPRKWNGEGPTITACSLPDDYVHFEQPRSLTVREWARIQTFPDWYQFFGKRTTGGIRRAGNPRLGIHTREVPKYTQIGNAVPVELARRIGEHFKWMLNLD